MKERHHENQRIHLVASALSAILTVSAFAQEKNLQAFSPAELTERTLHRRAIEAVIWGMPAVNAELMFQAMHDAKADFNQVVYWSRPVSWKNQTLTPNPDTIYLMPFYNTKDAGPMVLEIPAGGEGESITGSVDEAWQTAIEDVGPAGVDKGKGGKYLILPPGYKEPVPEGYIAMPSGTYTGYALLRSILRAPAKPTSPKPWPTASASSSTRFAGGQSSADKVRRFDRHRVRQRPFHTTCGSFKRSTASCNESLGTKGIES